MSTFVVQSGRPLSGTYSCSGAKNAGPKLLIAACLSDKECIFHNIPRISDTFKIIEAINKMGGEAAFLSEHEDEHSVRVNCANLDCIEVPEEVMSARQSVLFIGALLARFGEIVIRKELGGDDIGKRPINRMLDGMVALGAQINESDTELRLEQTKRPKDVQYIFEKNSHTGTEALLLAGVFNESAVTLGNAAREPEVDNLIDVLNQMGAKIERKGDGRTIKITGVQPLLNGCEVSSMHDRLEGATALALATLCDGAVEVCNIKREHVNKFVEKLEEAGVELEWKSNCVKLVKVPKLLKPLKIMTAIHPGFMTDWQPVMSLLLAVKGDGKSNIHEKIFPSRWGALAELSKMGIKYELFEPEGYDASDYNFNSSEYRKGKHAAYLFGPSKLTGAKVHSLDVRAGIDVLIAALFAKGESTIYDPSGHIDRGYENIVSKLTTLGADIKRL